MGAGFTTDFKKSQCCGDEVFTLAGQNELHFNFTEFDFSQSVFVIAHPTTFVHLLDSISKKEAEPLYYPPPSRATDLNVLHQVFLI